MSGIQVLGIVAAYLIGGIPFGLLAGLARGVDVRTAGSGNIGATNVIRVAGAKLGLLVFLLDLLKGVAAVMICRALGMEGWLLPTVGLMAVMAHSFSPYLAFKGGKGVATALGVLIGVHPLSAAIAFGLWLVLAVTTRYVSLASILAVTPVPAVIYFLAPSHNAELAVTIAPLSLLIIGRHNENIERLLAGTENRFGRKRQADTESADTPTEEPQTADE